MPQITIGPCRTADATGTHEPGAIITNPSSALIALAEAKTVDPESGKQLATVTFETPPPAPAVEPAPKDKTP